MIRDSAESQHVHLVGIGGTGMSALAGYLLDAGVTITGSDIRRGESVQMLERAGVRISTSHAARNLPSRADHVIRSLAVDTNVPEIRAADRRGIPVDSYPVALAGLAAGRIAVGVAGTHGKTTTAGMIGHLLQTEGDDPSWIFGGVPGRRLRPWRAGKGGAIILESCEYARSLLAIPVDIAVITAIDDDHLDCYGDIAGVRATFMRYAESVLERGGQVVLASDLGLTDELVSRGTDRKRIRSFGLAGRADVGASGIETTPEGTRFVLMEEGSPRGQIRLPQIGTHNVHNALAAIAVGQLLGHPVQMAGRALSSFPGVGRRLERVPSASGLIVYDDYAHHPTAVSAVLRSLRAAHPGRRLIAVFEPHQVARTLEHLSAFAAALDHADITAVTDIYAAREGEEDSVSGDVLVKRLQARGRSAVHAPGMKDVLGFLSSSCSTGDVVIVMGAGEIGDLFASSFAGAGQRDQELVQ